MCDSVTSEIAERGYAGKPIQHQVPIIELLGGNPLCEFLKYLPSPQIPLQSVYWVGDTQIVKSWHVDTAFFGRVRSAARESLLSLPDG